MGAVRADLERVQGQARVVDRAGRAGEVVDEVDGPVDPHEFGQIVVDELELGLADVLDVLERPRIEVVDADHAVSLLEQELAQMRTEEARPSRYDANRHQLNSNNRLHPCLTISFGRSLRINGQKAPKERKTIGTSGHPAAIPGLSLVLLACILRAF